MSRFISFLKSIYINLKLYRIKKFLFLNFYKIISYKSFQNPDCITFSKRNKNVFFGYYDINPISKRGDKILAMVTSKIKHKNSLAKIGYYFINNANEFHVIDSTDLWCWQQGCRLRWSIIHNHIYYNKKISNKYCSVLQNIEDKSTVKIFDRAFYDISRDEKFGLSLNFSRLERLRKGYGYSLLPDSTINQYAPKDDGIFLVNLKKNTNKLIIPVSKIAKINPNKTMDKAAHYFNHLSFNKAGNRFLFFHLWNKNNKRYSRLFSSNLDGSDIFLIEGNEIVSHYDWLDDKNICLTTYSKENGLTYNIFKDKSKLKKTLNKKLLNEDGHPTFHPKDKNLILSDTYPDKFSKRKLFVYNILDDSKYIIGEYSSNIFYEKDYRCDLHPRWSDDGNYVSFDSSHTGVRTLNVINFENYIHT